MSTKRKGAGRPRKTSKREDDRILSLSNANRFDAAPKIRSKINEGLTAPISVSTKFAQKRIDGPSSGKNTRIRNQ